MAAMMRYSRRGRTRNPNPRRGGGNYRGTMLESNGPGGEKVRGSSQQIYDKYMQLARDASTSGDRVMAENYLQHAEHYLRMSLENASIRPYDRETGGRELGEGERGDRESSGNAYSSEDADGEELLDDEEDDHSVLPPEISPSDAPRRRFQRPEFTEDDTPLPRRTGYNKYPSRGSSAGTSSTSSSSGRSHLRDNSRDDDF